MCLDKIENLLYYNNLMHIVIDYTISEFFYFKTLDEARQYGVKNMLHRY